MHSLSIHGQHMDCVCGLRVSEWKEKRIKFVSVSKTDSSSPWLNSIKYRCEIHNIPWLSLHFVVYCGVAENWAVAAFVGCLATI